MSTTGANISTCGLLIVVISFIIRWLGFTSVDKIAFWVGAAIFLLGSIIHLIASIRYLFFSQKAKNMSERDHHFSATVDKREDNTPP